MGEVSTTIDIDVPSIVAYEYLKDVYLDSRHLDSEKRMKGYIPNVCLSEDQPKRMLAYFVAGRDPALRTKAPGWNWSYTLEELVSGERTRITIRYSWGMGLALLSFGTARHQAANAASGDIQALIALEAGFEAAERPR